MRTSGWVSTRLSKVLDEVFAGAWGESPSDSVNPNVYVLRATNIDNVGRIDYSQPAPRVFSARELTRKKLIAGDLIVEASGGGPGTPVGRVALHKGGAGRRVYACSNFFRAMRPNLSIVDPDFLTQVLVKVYRSPAIWRYQQQTTGLVNLKFRDYLEQPLLLPPLNEQRRIVELIEAVSAQERAIEASIAKLSVIRASLVQVKLDQLYADHVRMALDDVASVERGRFSARPRNDPSYFGGQYHFIQTGDVVSAQGGVIWQSSQRLNEAGLSVSRMFPAGTVAVTIAANIGDTAILGERMCFPDSVVGVVAQAGFTPRFLELCLRRAKPQLEAQAPQSAQRNINLQALRPLGIPDVPQEVQDELVNTWDACGEEVGSLKEELTKLRKLKQGLVTDLLSGRISA